jgi:hypothetical protein
VVLGGKSFPALVFEYVPGVIFSRLSIAVRDPAQPKRPRV